MNIKDTAILLLFLLCITGLIIGVHYSEVSEIKKVSKYEKTVKEEDGIITVSLDKIEKEEKVLKRLFT
jgi:hypothetical protein